MQMGANTGTPVLHVTVLPSDNSAVRLCSSLSAMNSIEDEEDEILLCISRPEWSVVRFKLSWFDVLPPLAC